MFVIVARAALLIIVGRRDQIKESAVGECGETVNVASCCKRIAEKVSHSERKNEKKNLTKGEQ